MPMYDYQCPTHGYFELKQSMKDHAQGECPDCGTPSPQVILKAPSLDVEAMARVGMPGAWETVGDRITERHRRAGQNHTSRE